MLQGVSRPFLEVWLVIETYTDFTPLMDWVGDDHSATASLSRDMSFNSITKHSSVCFSHLTFYKWIEQEPLSHLQRAIAVWEK